MFSAPTVGFSCDPKDPERVSFERPVNMLVSFSGNDFKLVIFLVCIQWINWSSFILQSSTLKHPVAYSARVSFQLRRKSLYSTQHATIVAPYFVRLELRNLQCKTIIKFYLRIDSIAPSNFKYSSCAKRLQIKMINFRECCIYSCRYELYIKGCRSLNFHYLMIDGNKI